MPVAREEDEELVWGAVVEACTCLVVIVVNNIWAILAVWFAGKMVDDAETFYALYHILEIDVMVMAFAATFLQRVVLAVFHTDGEVGTWNWVLAARNGEQVGLGYEVEECLPLFRILLILQVEIYQVHAAVGVSLLEAIAPLTLLVPFLGSLHQLRVVAIVLCIDSFLLRHHCDGWSHRKCCHEC